MLQERCRIGYAGIILEGFFQHWQEISKYTSIENQESHPRRSLQVICDYADPRE